MGITVLEGNFNMTLAYSISSICTTLCCLTSHTPLRAILYAMQNAFAYARSTPRSDPLGAYSWYLFGMFGQPTALSKATKLDPEKWL